jgi:hypothetical protein
MIIVPNLFSIVGPESMEIALNDFMAKLFSG